MNLPRPQRQSALRARELIRQEIKAHKEYYETSSEPESEYEPSDTETSLSDSDSEDVSDDENIKTKS